MTPRETFLFTAQLLGAEAHPATTAINTAMGWPPPLRGVARAVTEIVEEDPPSFALIERAFADVAAEYRSISDLLDRCRNAQLR